MAFYFGAAQPTTTTAPGAPPATAAPTPAPTTVNLSTTSRSLANIPPFHDSFPRLKYRNAVLNHLERVKEGHSGRELIRLLSAVGGNDDDDDDEPIGKILADPTGILKRGEHSEEGLRNALMRSLENDANATGSAKGVGLFGSSAFGSSFTNTSTQQQQQQQQQQQVCVTLHDRPAAITPFIAKDILRLSDELHLNVVDCVALYAEANAIVLGGNAMESERKELQDDFVETLIRKGKLGIVETNREEKGSTVKPQHQSELSPVVLTARRLFFHERAALLSTVLDLIRHRIEAADESTNSSCFDEPNPVIVATDLLLQLGLVGNLVKTIRELNDRTREIRRGLRHTCDERKEAERRSGMVGSTVNNSGGGAFGGVGGMFDAVPVATTGTVDNPPEHDLDMECAFLGFTQMQRHLAAECLFYLAYHTQFTGEEVASLIDLIKGLTNGNASLNDEGLPLLNPLTKDVPNPYEETLDSLSTFSSWQQLQQQHYGMGAWNKPIPVKMKDEKQWKSELISNVWGRGQPQLLQCVSTLIMSVVCALDARHVLMEREHHRPNHFGKGNALLPPIIGDVMPSSSENFQSIHSRLDPESQDVENQWNRRDIWGLLLVPYALLLRNAAGPQLLSPSRAVGGSRSSPSRSPPVRVGQLNIKATYTKCLVVASQLKSLTFARMSLIPSFGGPVASSLESYGVDASIGDFYVSVFSDFTAQFIDALCATGNLPITRSEWYDEEFNLAQTEWAEKEQKRLFGVWAGQAVSEDASGPREVNVLDRPDCLEDIFALLSSICSTHPEGSQAFWKIVEEEFLDEQGLPMSPVVRLAPSRFLERLDLIHADSDSLLFVYISFLASLALAEGTGSDDATNGASTIHSFLCGDRSINHQSERHVPFGWKNVVNAIRFYAEHLSPDEGKESKSPTDSFRRSSSNVDASESSTSYYYGVNSIGASNATTSSSSPEPRGQGRPSSPDDPKKKDLGEVGTNMLMALLCLVANVAARCCTAREHILGLELPVQHGDVSNESYQEGSLEVLFSLLTTPISPDIKGMTFTAIANLLQPTHAASSTPGDSSISKAGKRAWELLEERQLLPIKLLENGSLNSSPVALSSFVALGRNQNLDAKELQLSVFPSSVDYGLIHVMEHVEAEAGTYPCTEGFMFLLTTLIRSVGCPPDLGSQWRSRSGCSPYIEFVINFVLPRATGSFKNVKPLPFATAADECRVISRVLEVIETIIVRYVVPFRIENFSYDQFKIEYQAFLNVAKNDPGVSLLFPEILRACESLDADEVTGAIQDFKNIYINPQDSEGGATSQAHSLVASAGHQVIPLPKTPGFYIMSSLLSCDNGQLRSAILKLLYQNGGSGNVHEWREHNMNSWSLATALFRDTPPSLLCSKSYVDYTAQQQRKQVDQNSYQSSISSLQQSMIQSVHPSSLLSCSENGCQGGISHDKAANDAFYWRERTILSSLRILCAAAAREEAFTQLLKKSSLTIVPTLSFKGPIHGSFSHRLLEEQKVYLAKLSNLLTKGSTGACHTDILPLIADYVGYGANSLKDHQAIAKNSFCIVSYIIQTLPQSESVRFLCGNDTNGYRLANAFSKGLLLPMNKGEQSMSIQNAILDLIISNIGIETSSHLNLSLVTLGHSGQKHNCLIAVLDLISNVSFVLDPKTSLSAAKCFELIFRLMRLGVSNTPSKLLSPHFWCVQAMRYLGFQGPSSPSILHEVSRSFCSDYVDDVELTKRNCDVLHSISWILKCLALELYSLVGDGRGHPKLENTISTQSLSGLLDMLFSPPNSLLQMALFDLPLGGPSNESLLQSINSLPLTHDVLKQASVPMQGPIDACARFEIVDLVKLSSYLRNSLQTAEEAPIGWATAWNSFVARVCACFHISQAWSDVCRTGAIVSFAMERSGSRIFCMKPNVLTEMLCSILLRLNSRDSLDEISQRCVLHGAESATTGRIIDSESALPLSAAALCLTDILLTKLVDPPETSEFIIAGEDVTRISALLHGAISSCAQGSTRISYPEERATILKCTLSQILAFSEGGD